MEEITVHPRNRIALALLGAVLLVTGCNQCGSGISVSEEDAALNDASVADAGVADVSTGDGAMTDGVVPDGRMTDGRMPDGAATDGAAADGATADGATADGSTADGSTADGSTADGSTADGATADGPTADAATADGATADGSTPDAATADAATADGATADGSTPDAATPDSATADGSTPDAATADRSTPDAATPDAASSSCSPLPCSLSQQLALVPMGALWRYLDDGSDQGTGWRDPSFNDDAWAAGPAELGYGDDDEATLVSYGLSANNKHITTYFRHRFSVADPGAYAGLVIYLLRDDGAVVFLNGAEVMRSNMPAGSVDSQTRAVDSEAAELIWRPQDLNPSALVAGDNVIAVEVHQQSPSSSDLSFELELWPTSGNSPSEIETAMDDGDAYHVHAPGQAFSVDVTPSVTAGSVDGALWAQWRDFRGLPLGPTAPLALGAATDLSAPGSAPGYYGLAVECEHADVALNPATGARRELGFVVLPALPFAGRQLAPDSPFGMVQLDIDDPYMAPGYIKTRTDVHAWDSATETLNASSWQGQIAARRDNGHLEVPLVSSDDWRSDDTAPITQPELDLLQDKMGQYFAAEPSVIYWELGLEEREGDAYYWDNLVAKVAAVRAAADANNPAVKLIYQVVNERYSQIEQFFALKATHGDAFYDILSLHLYPWTDFESPEEWMPAHIAATRDLMVQHSVDLPLWITEMGAPHQGTRFGYYGYSSGAEDRGTTRRYGAEYLVRANSMALQEGIEKVFWYNYRDRGPDPHYPEDHFGAVDHWDYPKPAYPAFVTMVDLLKERTPLERREILGAVQIHEYSGATSDVLLVWTYPQADLRVSLDELRAGLTSASVLEVRDTVGGPLALDGEELVVTRSPAYIVIQ